MVVLPVERADSFPRVALAFWRDSSGRKVRKADIRGRATSDTDGVETE